MVGNLQEDYDDFGKNEADLIILHVFVDQNPVHPDSALRSVDSFNITYPVIAGDDGYSVKEAYGVYQKGANDPFILMSPEGEIVAGYNIYTTFIEQNSFRKKLRELGITKEVSTKLLNTNELSSVNFVNSSNPKITFTKSGNYRISIFNLTGRKITTINHNTEKADNQVRLFKKENYPSGLYLIKITNNNLPLKLLKFNYSKNGGIK